MKLEVVAKEKVAQEKLAIQLKELEKESGRNATSKKAGESEELYQKRIAQGAYAFDFKGKPMLVKRAKVERMPKMMT